MIFPELPPVVDFRKIPWAAVPPALPACRWMLRAAALGADVGLGPGLTCEILRVPWPVSWPDTSHALNAVLADTTFRPALFFPPSAARLKTPTWSPEVLDVDLALTATPEDTVTAMVGVVVGMDTPVQLIQRSSLAASPLNPVLMVPPRSSVYRP